jgi:hypothetical protein
VPIATQIELISLLLLEKTRFYSGPPTPPPPHFVKTAWQNQLIAEVAPTLSSPVQIATALAGRMASHYTYLKANTTTGYIR